MESTYELPSQKTIYKNAINIAWPAILESFLMALTGFLDSIMVSSQGDAAIAAVGLTGQPKFIGLAIFISIGIAISSIVARRRGEQNAESANRLLKMILVVVLILTAIISAIFFFFSRDIMLFAGAQEDTVDIATEYLTIIMSCLIFQTITNTINAAQRGAGNTRISMITNTTSNVVNVIFNYLLIEGNFGFPALGVSGAAIATVIGTIVACGMSIKSLFKKDSFIYIKAYKGIMTFKTDIKSLIDITASAFTEQFFLRVGFFLFNLTVASLGTMQTASHTIAMSFMSISFSFADGLSVSSVALVGRSLGQKKPELAKKYGSACQKIGLVCAVFVSTIYAIFARPLYTLFTDTESVIELGMPLMYILCVVLYLQIQQVAIIGCLRGAGDTKYTAFISLVSVAIIRPFVSWLFCYPLGLGLFGVWMGLFGDQFIRFVMGYVRYKQGKWLKIEI